jgi:hypothetical protein
MEEKVGGETEDSSLPSHIPRNKLYLGRESQPLTVPGLLCFLQSLHSPYQTDPILV